MTKHDTVVVGVNTRYTHYSATRTMEDALGLGTLTANDKYADPFNGIFP